MSTAVLSPKAKTDASVMPLHGETQLQFFKRASQLLAPTIHKMNKRSVAIIRAWQKSQSDADIRDEARERFPDAEYTHQGPRCIFISHVVPAAAEEKDGEGNVVRRAREEIVYGESEIEAMVNYANFRIRNAGQFSVLCEGHMPTQEEKDAGRPDAEPRGYAGPFYIAMFGNAQPKWAIFADEWICNEDLQRSNKLQRRSPEVWYKEPIERRTMDPIAMLGAETPRLDSGMNLYSKRADGQDVIRYSMGMSVAMPGHQNSYVPGGSHTRYGANEMDDPQNSNPDPSQQADGSGVDPQEKQIVDAIINVLGDKMPALVQAVKEQLGAGGGMPAQPMPTDPSNPLAGGGADPTDPSADPAMGDTPRGMEQPDAGADPSADPSGGAMASAPDPTAAPATPPAASPAAGSPAAPAGQQTLDQDHAKYAAMSPQCGQAYAAGHAAGSSKGRPMTYAKDHPELMQELAAKDQQIAALNTRVLDLERDRRDAERYAKVHDLASRKNIGDEREFLEEVLPMEDVEFDRYMKAAERLSANRDDMTNVDVMDDAGFDVERDNYSRAQQRSGKKHASQAEIDRYSREAQDSFMRKRGRGEETTFDQEFATILTSKGYAVDF